MSLTAVYEFDIERDRKTCIKLFANVTGANRDLAQWLLDHPRYSAATVAEWLECSARRIRQLRQWAKEGFLHETERDARTARYARNHGSASALKSQENLEETLDEDIETAPPEEIRENVLHYIERMEALVKTFKKVIKVASLDQAMKDEVSTALGGLITKCQSLQRALRPRR